MAKRIDDAVLDVLRGATVEGCLVRLGTGKLPDAVYKGVNDVLTRLGGKWKGGKTAAHVFPSYPATSLALVVESGELPPKNPFAYFPTIPDVADRMVDLLHPEDSWLVLEPSAGEGALAGAIRRQAPGAGIICVELDGVRAESLRGNDFQTFLADFLVWDSQDRLFDGVIMNPPFSVAGDATAYVTHIRRALGLLKPGGQLVSLAPISLTYSRTARVRELKDELSHCEELPAGTFRSVGTDVATCIVHIQR